MSNEDPKTLSDLVYYVAEKQAGRAQLVSTKIKAERVWWSTDDWVGRIVALAAALEKRGIGPGERVAIFSENCPEWHIVEFACQLLGVVSVPLYPTLPADQVAFILADSGTKTVFFSNQKKLEILNQAQILLDSKLELIAFADDTSHDVVFDHLLDEAPAQDPAVFGNRPKEDDIASLIYTSGTTGNPKGVALSHRNLVSNMITCAKLVPISDTDSSLSFLPLSHVLQRTVDNIFFYKGVSIHYVQSIELVARALTEIHPTVLASVPRLYERAYLRVLGNVEQQPGGKQKIFRWGVGIGERHAEARRTNRFAPHLAAQRTIAKRLVYAKIHERMGGRLRLAITGGAALPESVGRFFEAVGLDLFEGYGLTETSPVLCLNRPGEQRWGTVGKPIPGVELRIAEDGEILARSPGLMQGYWNNDEATQEAIDADGWFHTGDVGVIDEDGYLAITDRKKDLLVTSGGKNIAPQPLEQRLTSSGVIAQAVVIGDNYPYLTALLVPNLEELPPDLAAIDPDQRIKHPRILERIEETIAHVNRQVADHERIRRWKLLPRELSLEEGEITPTLKIKRNVVLQRYEALVSSMYLKSQRVDR